MKPELKANVAELTLKRVFALFMGDKFKGIVEKFVRRNYNKGMMAREIMLKLNTNPVPNKEKIDVMTDYTSAEIQGVLTDMNKQIAQTIREGIINNENPDTIRKKVQAILNPTNASTFHYPSGRRMNWRDRIKMITRTESVRAQNIGHMDTFLQSGLEGKKYLSATGDACHSMCEPAAELYTKDKAIPVDEEFIVKDGKKTYRFNAPPIHPNCRCRLMFNIDGGENA